MTRTEVVEDRWVFRLGGVAAVAGALLGMVGNLIHPVTPIDDPAGVARVIADSGAWAAMHYAIVLGIVLMLGGLVAIHRSIRGGLAGPLSRFGLVAAISGATIGLVLVILDGVAARQLAEEWSDASTNRDVALALVHGTRRSTSRWRASSISYSRPPRSPCLARPRSQRAVPPLAGMGGGGRGWALVRGRRSDQAFVGEPTDASRIVTNSGTDDDHAVAARMGVLLIRMSPSRLNSRLPSPAIGA